MEFEIIDPIDYHDWDEILLSSGDYSFFHTSGWANVLAESYGYKPVYFARLENNRLSFLMPFMEISSRLTGKRGVSLPFTDYCDPFAPEKEILQEAEQTVINFGKRAKWKYIDWRNMESSGFRAIPSESYFAHALNLERSESEIFFALKENNRRNIRKAQKEGISVTIDQSWDSLKSFCRLNSMTRKRHGIPPQPFSFFKNIHNHVLSKQQGIVVTALFSGKTIAAAVFFHFGPNAIYKYGASDPKYLSCRPNNLVIWEAIKWFKNKGVENLSLGRTEIDNHGLLNFKRSWGAMESTLEYIRYDIKKRLYIQKLAPWELPNRIFIYTPVFVLRLIGRFLYKHVG